MLAKHLNPELVDTPIEEIRLDSQVAKEMQLKPKEELAQYLCDTYDEPWVRASGRAC